MIKIKVSDLLGKHKMNRRQLAEAANIRPNTVGALYDETIKRLDKDMLNRLCKVFDCQISDILEYIPDTEEETKDKEQA